MGALNYQGPHCIFFTAKLRSVAAAALATLGLDDQGGGLVAASAPTVASVVAAAVSGLAGFLSVGNPCQPTRMAGADLGDLGDLARTGTRGGARLRCNHCLCGGCLEDACSLSAADDGCKHERADHGQNSLHVISCC